MNMGAEAAGGGDPPYRSVLRRGQHDRSLRSWIGCTATSGRLRPVGTLGRWPRFAHFTPRLVRTAIVCSAPEFARSARLPRLAPEAVQTEEYVSCLFARLSEGRSRTESLEEQHVAMVDVAHRAARHARAILIRPGLTQPALLVEAAMRVYMLARAGKLAAASQIADAVPHIGRVWKNGAAHPVDIRMLYRRWVEESVMIRAAAGSVRGAPPAVPSSR